MSVDPKEFMTNMLSALQDPSQQSVIMDQVKRLIPSLTDEQRQMVLSQALQSLQGKNPVIPKPTTDPLLNDYQRLLTLATLPIETLETQRTEYYTSHNLPYPRDYEPRTKMEKWDHIDLFECVHYIASNQYKDYYEKVLSKYQDFLRSHLTSSA
jgi:hypothetical protein